MKPDRRDRIGELLDAARRLDRAQREAWLLGACGDDTLRADVQCAVDDANLAVSSAEAIKVFRILPRDFSEAARLDPDDPHALIGRALVRCVKREYADAIRDFDAALRVCPACPRAVAGRAAAGASQECR